MCGRVIMLCMCVCVCVRETIAADIQIRFGRTMLKFSRDTADISSVCSEKCDNDVNLSVCVFNDHVVLCRHCVLNISVEEYQYNCCLFYLLLFNRYSSIYYCTLYYDHNPSSLTWYIMKVPVFFLFLISLPLLIKTSLRFLQWAETLFSLTGEAANKTIMEDT